MRTFQVHAEKCRVKKQEFKAYVMFQVHEESTSENLRWIQAHPGLSQEWKLAGYRISKIKVDIGHQKENGQTDSEGSQSGRGRVRLV